MNRLKLDFSLEKASERKDFIDKYLNEINFNPTNAELETISNYLLWGKVENGKSIAEDADIELERRQKTWSKASKCESLDALMEQPTFNEATLDAGPPTKIKKEVFSREAALRDAPDELKKEFESLFRQIDELDYEICLYEIANGRREKEPREDLTKRFTEKDRFVFEGIASGWDQYHYLKMRHRLKELRDTQYTLRDSYTNVLLRPFPQFLGEEEAFELEVWPLGNAEDSPAIFVGLERLVPSSYNEEDLKKISFLYWQKEKDERPSRYFDFTNPEHVGGLIEFYDSLDGPLIDTFEYYRGIAKLSEAQREILDMKIQKKNNEQIKVYINEKYGKHYMTNYISTIFRQKIIPAINNAADFHKEIVSNLWFEENFKKCTSCGQTMLRHENNFMRKARSKDGFNTRCKDCEKKARSKGGKA